MASCRRRQEVVLLLMLFATYSLAGAVIEHLCTNVHSPLLSAIDPVRYPGYQRVQTGLVLPGFPMWSLTALGVWKINSLFEAHLFTTEAAERSLGKLIFDFCFWTVALTLLEYGVAQFTSAGPKKAHIGMPPGFRRGHDYTYMKYHYKGVIALPISLALGVAAAAFIRINPHLINLFRKGIDQSVC